MEDFLAMILGRKRKMSEQIRINPNVASSTIILANPNSHRRYLDGKLKEISNSYDIGHAFKSCIEKPHFYSEQLVGFLGSLRSLGLIDDLVRIPENVDLGSDTIEAFALRMRLRGIRGPVNRFSLTPEGTDFLEERVLHYFAENPDDALKFIENCGLSIKPLFQKYITRYLERNESLSRKIS